MSMDKDLIEDKLYELIDPLNERKLIIGIFILPYLTIYIHVMMGMGELIRHYLLPISVSYNFSNISTT